MNKLDKKIESLDINRDTKAKRKVLFLNRTRCALKKIQMFLKKNGYSNPKPYNCIVKYCKIMDYFPPPKSMYREWLFILYTKGEDKNVKHLEDIDFYSTFEWKELRKLVFKIYGDNCLKCGSNENLAIDHIKPRSIYPELELEFDNLQVLCRSCNSKKSNKVIKDYRKNIIHN